MRTIPPSLYHCVARTSSRFLLRAGPAQTGAPAQSKAQQYGRAYAAAHTDVIHTTSQRGLYQSAPDGGAMAQLSSGSAKLSPCSDITLSRIPNIRRLIGGLQWAKRRKVRKNAAAQRDTKKTRATWQRTTWRKKINLQSARFKTDNPRVAGHIWPFFHSTYDAAGRVHPSPKQSIPCVDALCCRSTSAQRLQRILSTAYLRLLQQAESDHGRTSTATSASLLSGAIAAPRVQPH